MATKKGIAFNYFDDICVYAKNWTILIEYLEVVLKLLCDANLTLNLGKCKFAMSNVKFLGYILGNGKIKQRETNIKAIE